MSIIFSGPLRALVEECESLGIDRKRLLDRAGVEPSELAKPFIDGDLAKNLWETAADVCPDGALGFRAAARIAVGAYGLAEFWAISNSTMRLVFTRTAELANNGPLALRMDVNEEPVEGATITYSDNGDHMPELREHYIASHVMNRIRMHTPAQMPYVAVTFTREPQDGWAAWSSRLGCPVSLGPRLKLHLTAQAWETELFSADPQTHDSLTGTLASLGTSPTEMVRSRVRTAIRATLCNGASIVDVAARLGQSYRALQRQLQRAGFSFEQLRNDERLLLAKQLLATESTFAEIALELGFSEQSAFSRAFRRLAGATPTQFRRESKAA